MKAAVLVFLALGACAHQDSSDIVRWRSKRQVGRSCQFGTDCGRGAFCDSRRFCRCLSTFVNYNNQCLQKINPDEVGCQNQVQCSSVWQDATCNSGTCRCANNQPAYTTRDGPVCVNYGACPTANGIYTKLVLASGQEQSCPGGADAGCPSTYDCICGNPTDCATAFCCPTRALACIQAADSGSTSNSGGFSTRYYYNPAQDACLSFSYRGSGGNANNFYSQSQCESYCMQACGRGAPSYNAPNPVVGSTQAKGSRIYCSGSNTNSCGANFECRLAGGQESVRSEYLCCPTPTFICSRNGGAFNTGVTTNYDPGTSTTASQSSSSRWYYDIATQTCRTFSYLGQGGNFNNFLSQGECESFCAQVSCTAGEPLKDTNGVSNRRCTGAGAGTCPATHACNSGVCCPNKQYLCGLPVAIGSGPLRINRYYYNAASRTCIQFTYTGSNGNDNSFSDYESCQSFCVDVYGGPTCPQGSAYRDSGGNYVQCNGQSLGFNGIYTVCPQTHTCTFDSAQTTYGCCPTKTYTCSLSYDQGTQCGPSVSRWYYNTASGRCDTFTYYGCDGNSNNFATQTDCNSYCGGGGCPDGGEPYRQSNGQYLACGGSAFCPDQHTCSSVTLGGSTNNVARNYCCPTKAYTCSLPRSVGQTCGAGSVARYFFNTVTRNCEAFTYGGCSGNQNNFQNLQECRNFCNSAGCPTGQIVQQNAITGIITTCQASQFNVNSFQNNFANTCGSGYTCVYSTLLGQGVCCGSNAPADTCPSGQSAYVNPANQQPQTCAVNILNSCPAGFSCYYSPTQNTYSCCGSSVVQCPSGGSPYIETGTNAARQCTPGFAGACPSGTTCQPTAVTINGVLSTTGYCCGQGANYCGTGYVLATLGGLSGQPIQCAPENQAGCPSPSFCKQSTSFTSTFGGIATLGYYCCQRDGINNVGAAVCPTTETAYVVNNAPVTCNDRFDPTHCPPPYNCRLYSGNNQYYCCQPGGIVNPQPASRIGDVTEGRKARGGFGGCPPGYFPLQSGAQPVRCSPGQQFGSCAAPNVCQFSQSDNGYICCTNGQQPTTPTVVCSSGGAPYTNPFSRLPQTCSPSLGVSGCPSGYSCGPASGAYYCCPGFAPVTQPPRVSGDGCGGGRRAFLYPQSQRPLQCFPSRSTCPSGYQCEASLSYPGNFQCCTISRSKRSIAYSPRLNCGSNMTCLQGI